MKDEPREFPEPMDCDVEGFATDSITVGSDDDGISVVLTCPELDVTLIFTTNPAGARQVAASLLNHADDLDPYVDDGEP